MDNKVARLNLENDLHAWAEDLSSTSYRGGKWQALNSDASFRRYFRLFSRDGSEEDCSSRIAVYSPPDSEKNREFVSLAELLLQGGVRAPKVFAADFQQGFLLLEDLGDAQLFTALNKDNADSIYQLAIKTLLDIQEIPREKAGDCPDYNAQMLEEELLLFPEWFADKLLGVRLDHGDWAVLKKLFANLVANALEQPQLLTHRDYHSRNLMLIESGRTVGVIDFQDAVWGPLSYDLVSLLKDCYICWPVERRAHWTSYYLKEAAARGLSTPTMETFERWLNLTGLQRHLKVLGIFSRLWLRDGKRGYLNDLPLVVNYVMECAALYPQLQEFEHWFRKRLAGAPGLEASDKGEREHCQ